MVENNMPETSEQSASLVYLSDQNQEIFSWHRSRVKCKAALILTVIRLHSANLKRLAQEINPDA